MHIDPITEEIRAIRKQLAAQCGNDVRRIMADARARQAAEGRAYVTLPPRRLQVKPENVSAAGLRSDSVTGG